MAVCTFFGHRQCPDTIRPKLKQLLTELITNYKTDMFYIGHQGQFDSIARSVLYELKAEYPWINFAIVLAYMPSKQDKHTNFSDTMIPEGIECVPPRYAIVWRNNWLLQQSDYVVTYITHSWGGAAKFAQKALSQKKMVFELGRDHSYKRDTL